MAPRRTKTWKQKFEQACDKDVPKVIKIDAKLSQRWGKGTCVIPSPREVEVLMRQVPKGKLTTIGEMRALLAKRHRATIASAIRVCGSVLNA